MKKLSKLLLLSVVFLIITTTIVGCGTVKLNNSDAANTNEEITPQDQWWTGTYDWVSHFVVGNPNSDEQIYINYIKRVYPNSSYGNEIELTKEGKIIDHEWGCLESPEEKTSYGSYVIESSPSVKYSTGTEEIYFKRPAKDYQSVDNYFLVTKDGTMLFWVGGSERFLLGFKYQKRGE